MRLTRYSLALELTEERQKKMAEELAALSEVLLQALQQMDDRLLDQAETLLQMGDLFIMQEFDDSVLAVAYRSADCFWLAGLPVAVTEILKAVEKQGYGCHRFEVRTADKAMLKAAEKAGFKKVGVLRLGGFRGGCPVDTFLLDRVLGEQEHGFWRNVHGAIGAALRRAAASAARCLSSIASKLALQHTNATSSAGASTTASAGRTSEIRSKSSR